MAFRATQPPQLGKPLPDWSPRQLPPGKILQGRYCRLELLDPVKHGDDLVAAFNVTDPASWTFLFNGPYSGDAEIRRWLVEAASNKDFIYYVIADAVTGHAGGVAAYMRADPSNGAIEIGSIHYADALKRTPATTEAMFLLARHVFDDLGYRRYEWKCDSLNEPSRRTAIRLGFTFEGIFRQHMVIKGRSRDTAWFAIVDSDWPALKSAYDRWLSPENFEDGRQRKSLTELIQNATASKTV